MTPSQLMQIVGVNVKRARLQKFMRQTDFSVAAGLGIDGNTLRAIEKGRTDVKLSTLLKIAKAAEVDMLQLLIQHPDVDYEPKPHRQRVNKVD